MDNIFERPLTVDEVKRVGAFYIETRSTSFKTYFQDTIKIVLSIDDEAVHLLGGCEPYHEVAEFDNYNIGWRAWISHQSDDIRSSAPWDTVIQCNGIGYGWEYNRELYKKYHKM